MDAFNLILKIIWDIAFEVINRDNKAQGWLRNQVPVEFVFILEV